MFVLKSVLIVALLVQSVMGLGYLLNGEYYPIPQGAQMVIEVPTVPIANSPVAESTQFKRDAREPAAWRHIGLGKRSGAEKTPSWN